jgi:hypothetical protein
MCMSSVRVWCSCLLVICLQITSRQEHQTRTDDIHMWPHTAKLYKLNEHKSAGGIVMTQGTAEDPLKMVVKKDRNM